MDTTQSVTPSVSLMSLFSVTEIRRRVSNHVLCLIYNFKSLYILFCDPRSPYRPYFVEWVCPVSRPPGVGIMDGEWVRRTSEKLEFLRKVTLSKYPSIGSRF